MRTTHLFGPTLLLNSVFFSSCAPAAPAAQGPTGGVGAAVAAVAAQAACPVQGSWQLESVTMDGQRQPADQQWRQIKLVTPTHYAWVGQAPDAATQPPQSAADSLAAYRTRGFGGGTYQVRDSTYTERLEYFFMPDWVGREITFSCRVTGDQWHHTTDYPMIENGRETGRTRVEEVWRRIGPSGLPVRQE